MNRDILNFVFIFECVGRINAEAVTESIYLVRSTNFNATEIHVFYMLKMQNMWVLRDGFFSAARLIAYVFHHGTLSCVFQV